jgi:hypothetical protein
MVRLAPTMRILKSLIWASRKVGFKLDLSELQWNSCDNVQRWTGVINYVFRHASHIERYNRLRQLEHSSISTVTNTKPNITIKVTETCTLRGTDRLEREPQMVQVSATRCSCIAILWVKSSTFCRHNPLCRFSTSNTESKRIFRYRLSPETFGYTLVLMWNWSLSLFHRRINVCIRFWDANSQHIMRVKINYSWTKLRFVLFQTCESLFTCICATKYTYEISR